MPIVLVGMMGTGKSTIARLLAQTLSVAVWDTDQIVEKEAGKSVSEIFASQSEERFRELEAEVLKRVNHKMRIVLSTGGGIVLSGENRDYLKQLGFVVWLRAQPQTIAFRVKGDQTRPLLGDEPTDERVKNLCETRAPFYQETARMVIDVDGKTPFQIADQIISHYNRSK